MRRQLELVLSDLRGLSACEFDSTNRNSRGWERLDQLCDELQELNVVGASAPVMFDVMERLSDVDLGTPGPLVHTLELWAGKYEAHLADSIVRKPSPLAVWMVNRILNAKPANARTWLDLLRTVESHPLASAQTKADARHFLDHQGNPRPSEPLG